MCVCINVYYVLIYVPRCRKRTRKLRQDRCDKPTSDPLNVYPRSARRTRKSQTQSCVKSGSTKIDPSAVTSSQTRNTRSPHLSVTAGGALRTCAESLVAQLQKLVNLPDKATANALRTLHQTLKATLSRLRIPENTQSSFFGKNY